MGRRFDIIGVTDNTGSVFAVSKVTVTATATKLPTTNLDNRKAISVRNWSDTYTIYVGGSDVTSATGFPILPKESLPFAMSNGAQLYGICATGETAEVRTVEIDNS